MSRTLPKTSYHNSVTGTLPIPEDGSGGVVVQKLYQRLILIFIENDRWIHKLFSFTFHLGLILYNSLGFASACYE
jgi:hypothetical protein